MAAQAGQEIVYNLEYYFQMYLESPLTNGNTSFKCTVVECKNNIMVIHVVLPNNIRFSDKAYSLMRCFQEKDGSWNLLVINDEKYIKII